MDLSAEHKLHIARTRLMLDKPFLGALALHLPLIASEARWCKTLALDDERLFYNPRYIDSLRAPQIQFALAHVALHCALNHMARCGWRIRQRWDAACDYAVNQLLCDDGLTPPAGALLNGAFRGLSAEEIYPLIDSRHEQDTLERHLFESHPTAAGATQRQVGVSAPADSPDATGARKREASFYPGELDYAWRNRMLVAAQQARQSGRLGEVWRRLMEQSLAPTLPWRALLARFLNRLARHDYSFQRVSRRSWDEEDEIALLPSLATRDMRVVIALDTSGSVSAVELAEFVAEIDALKGQLNAHVTLHACDDEVASDGPWEFPVWQALQLPGDLGGGGGTRFTPIFDWIERDRLDPDCLLYFTDALGEFPAQPPPYPALWLVKGNANVPWGERVQLS